MIDLPAELTLYPSRKKWAGVTAIGAFFVAVGVMMIISEGGAMPWGCTLFFGLVSGVGLAQLFGGSYLRLQMDGFEQSLMGRKLNVRWTGVSQFGVWSTSGSQLIGFNYVNVEVTSIGKLNQSLAGYSHSLGDTFGMNAHELADLMNEFRDRAFVAAAASAFRNKQE